MSQIRRQVEITLHSLQMTVTGAGLDRNTSHLLTSELIWPRIGVARKSASQTCHLQEGTSDFEQLNWGKRILFKETVEGRFALSLAMTESLDDEDLEKLIRTMAGVALSLGANMVSAAAAPAGKLAAAPLDYAAKELSKYPGAITLAEGLVELDAAEFPPSGEQRLMTVRLVAARDLIRLGRKTNSNRPGVTRKRLLKKGSDNGEVTLLIRSL